MSSCYQFKEQTILEHGFSVAQEYKNLMLTPIETVSKNGLIPHWFIANHSWLRGNQLPPELIQVYLIYHDCGKFLVESRDPQGAVHFKDHARSSHALWIHLFGESIISDLILRDMDMHLLKPSSLSGYDRKDLIPTLLVCALAELLANCDMFGGPHSISFKIKLKALTRLGNAFFKSLKIPSNDKTTFTH